MRNCNFSIKYKLVIVTASCDRPRNALAEVEEPAEMGVSLGTGATRQRCNLPRGLKNYVPSHWLLHEYRLTDFSF